MDTKFENRRSVSVHDFNRLTMIAAMGRNNEIGINGRMPWHLPEDLKHFKQLTTGHPVIMGRLTWESLPKRPLPRRLNIIVSRGTHQENTSEVKWVNSAKEALLAAGAHPTPFVIGGGRIYKEMMPYASCLEITRIDCDFADADTFFPAIDPDQWIMTDRSETMVSEGGYRYCFERYERRNNQ